MLLLAAVTHASRHAVMPLVNDAVMGLGGWISGHELYGNMAAVFRFEMPAGRLPELADRLEAASIRLDATARSAMAAETANAGDIACALNVAFIHDEPDLRRVVPAVPG